MLSRRAELLISGFGLAILFSGFLNSSSRSLQGQEPIPTASAKATVPIGTKIAPFQLKDIRYLPRSLNELGEAKYYVLTFLTTSCPVAQRSVPTLLRLNQEFRSQGVRFVAVNVGVEDTIRDMAKQALDYQIDIPMLKDFGGVVAQKLGVTRTPEVVILDEHRVLRYRGRIDDRYRLGGFRSEPTRSDLKEALIDLLAGTDVRVSETPVDGCLITFLEQPLPKKEITYAEHVAPILRKHCVECHRPETAAPFALLTYEQAASRANTLAEVVKEERMPPWYASPAHGQFVNYRGLSDKEKQQIIDWVRQGKPVGDLAKLPPLPEEIAHPKSKWLIGDPDLVLSVSEHELPAEGEVAYKYVFLPYLFTEDTWIQDLQILPDNPRVVHHANLAYLVVGEGFKMNNFITGYVPGGEPMHLTDNIGFKIPKRSIIGIQIHYVTTGKPERCQIKIGLRYAREVVRKQLRFKLIADYRFAIPPEAPAHRVQARRQLEADAIGVGMFVHMHLRGRDMTFLAHRPDENKPEVLLVVPNYSFDWQMPYRWAKNSMRFPKGTYIECIAHYDNSPFNPYNPNPKATVRDGQQTKDEMMNGFFFYTHAQEDLNLTIDPKTGHVSKSTTSVKP